MLLALAACSSPDSPWQKVPAEGLPWSGFRAEHLLFATDSTGLLLGSALTDPALAQDELAVLYRTTKAGRSWQQRFAGRGGHFGLVVQAGSVLYLVHYDERQENGPTPSRILRSSDYGQHWQAVGTVPEQVVILAFADSAAGLAVANHTGPQGEAQRVVYRTTDGGRHWQLTGLKLPYITHALHTPNGQPWLLVCGPDMRHNARHLIRLDRATHRPQPEALPAGLAVDHTAVSDSAGNLWLAGQLSSDTVQLWRRDYRSGRYTLIRRFAVPGAPLLPTALHVAGRSISLLAAAPDTAVALNGYHFYHSSDLGQTWREEELPVMIQAHPYAFRGPDRVWLKSPGAAFQVR